MTDGLLKRLGRVTSSGAFYPEIDGLRAIAIVSVIAFHVQKYVPHGVAAPGDVLTRSVQYIAGKGFFGVELFFVISGFILSLPFATYYLGEGRKPSLLRYYQRRVLRLEPPYIISLLICFSVLVLAYGVSARQLLPHLAASLVYVRELLLGGNNPINGVLWSLECEVQFYVLAPLLATLFLIRRKVLRRVGLFCIPVLALGMTQMGRLLERVPQLGTIPLLGPMLHALSPLSFVLERVIVLHYAGYFCAGFLLADLFVDSWKQKPVKHWSWDVLGVVAWVALALLIRTDRGLYSALGSTLPYPLLILLAYMATFRGPLLNGMMRNRWMVTIGGMCYTEYLYHQVFLHMIQNHLGRMTQSLLVQIPVFLGLTLVLSAGLFVLFEKPFMYKDWHTRTGAWLRARWGQFAEPAGEVAEKD